MTQGNMEMRAMRNTAGSLYSTAVFLTLRYSGKEVEPLYSLSQWSRFGVAITEYIGFRAKGQQNGSRESAVQAHELAHAMCLYHPFHVQGRRVRLDHLLGHVQLLALDGVEELLSAVALRRQCEALVRGLLAFSHQASHSALPAQRFASTTAMTTTTTTTTSSSSARRLGLPMPTTSTHLLLQLYALLRLHMGQRAGSRSLVLCPTAELARVWGRALRGLGLPTLELHSRKSQAYREQAVHVFKHGAHGSGLGGLGEGEGEGLAGGGAPWGQAQAAAGQGGQGGPMQAGGQGQAQVPRGLVMLSSGGVTTGLDLPDLTLLVQVGLPHSPSALGALLRLCAPEAPPGHASRPHLPQPRPPPPLPPHLHPNQATSNQPGHTQQEQWHHHHSQQQQQRPSLWGQSQAQQQQQPDRVISCVPSVLLLTEQEALQLSSLHHKLLAAPDQQAFTAAAAAGAGAQGQPTSSSMAGLSPVQAQAGPGYYVRLPGYQLRDGQASAAVDTRGGSSSGSSGSGRAGIATTRPGYLINPDCLAGLHTWATWEQAAALQPSPSPPFPSTPSSNLSSPTPSSPHSSSSPSLPPLPRPPSRISPTPLPSFSLVLSWRPVQAAHPHLAAQLQAPLQDALAHVPLPLAESAWVSWMSWTASHSLLDMDAEAWQAWAQACAASLGLPQLPAISPGVARLWQSVGHSSLLLDSSPAGGEEGASHSSVGRQGTGQAEPESCSEQAVDATEVATVETKDMYSAMPQTKSHISSYAPNPCPPTVSEMADQEESPPGTASDQQEETAAVPADPKPEPPAVDDELKGEFWDPLADLLPPSDCELVTPDGGVLKKVLKPGHGDPPGLYARCLGKCIVLDLACCRAHIQLAQPVHAVHYLGRLQSSGSIFLDTKTESQSQQPVRVVAGRHTSPRESGLFKAVATMRAGERAAIYVQDPAYGYGEAGSFSFPAVPPGARLTYELECVDFEEAEDEDGESSGNLMYEERLERAEKRRLTGNQLFAEGKYREAMGKYATALSYLDEDFMMQLEGFYEDKANEVKVPIHLNMAACQLRIKDYHTAVYNCSEVLKLQPGNVKALFRRGTARHALGQTEGAKADLAAAAEKSPDDKAIRAELQALRQTLRAEREAEATLFKGQFKFADPKPSTVGNQEEQQVHNSQDTAQPGLGSSHPTLPLVAQPASLLSRALAGLWGLCSWLATMFGMLLGLKVPVKDR
ncbi:hypothetical protein QJQ45_026732 [Haematococcus lacustris]|nr:hypothetical protein QJQ45_026732 [Haematococcus lacustris]